MRKLILLFFFVSSALWLHAKDFTQYVSPLVGTQSKIGRASCRGRV